MNFDIAIFGGGVVGCSCFAYFTRLGKKCILLEKENDVSLGMSKANSGLIHAGYDCKPNTLKAYLNVKGNRIFESLASELKVKYKKTGALVVGNDLDKLNLLLEQGKQNKVKNLSIIDSVELKKLAPSLNDDIHYALYAKDAYIVSPYYFTIALAEEAVINGGKILFNFDALSITKEDDLFVIKDKTNIVKSKYIINAAGYGFNDISRLLDAEVYPLKYRKGEYFVLDKGTDFVSLPIFPLPTAYGKGILATPTASGNILFGPTASDEYDYDTSTSNIGLEKIREFINTNYKNVPWNKVIREYSGVRVFVKDDFIIEKSKVLNVINICGINSPGLSSAPAIAEYVGEMLGFKKEFINFKRREKPIKIEDLPISKANELIKQNPKYGNIVCRCEKISEGEIVDAINSPLSPCSIDGIKRRVRAGMGRCQGGFCTLKVAEIISREKNIPIESIVKDYNNSNIIYDDIRKTKFFKEKTNENL